MISSRVEGVAHLLAAVDKALRSAVGFAKLRDVLGTAPLIDLVLPPQHDTYLDGGESNRDGSPVITPSIRRLS